MEYKIEETGPVQRKVSVSVPAEEVNAALATAAVLYSRNVQVDGFRKGKAPMTLIQGRYRKQIVAEATTDLVNSHINEIMSEAKFQAVSPIHFEGEDRQIVKDQDFQYAFSMEIMPEFELPEYVGVEIEEEEPEVRMEEVDEVVNRIRQSLAEFKPIDGGGPAADGQIAVVSFTTLENGAPMEGLGAENFEFEVGTGQALPEFDALIKRLTIGETGESEVVFPEDFLNPELAGKTVTMRATVHNIKEKRLPEINDDLAKKAGNFSTVEAMRTAVVKSYMESRRSLNRSVAQKKLLDSLLAKVDFPLPASMVQEQINRMVLELKGKLERQGKSLESLGKSAEELRENYRLPAEDVVRSQIFLLNVARKEGMKVSDKDLDAYFREMAIRMNEDYSAVRAYHEEHDLMFAVRDHILADRAMESIYARAEVKIVKPEESAGEAGEKAGESGESAAPEAE